MTEKNLERLRGKYCKIVMKEPGKDKSTVVTGVIWDVDSDAGFIIIESDKGVGCMNIKTIVAIKPKEQSKI